MTSMRCQSMVITVNLKKKQQPGSIYQNHCCFMQNEDLAVSTLVLLDKTVILPSLFTPSSRKISYTSYQNRII